VVEPLLASDGVLGNALRLIVLISKSGDSFIPASSHPESYECATNASFFV
jgi:hypothetical protein